MAVQSCARHGAFEYERQVLGCFFRPFGIVRRHLQEILVKQALYFLLLKSDELPGRISDRKLCGGIEQPATSKAPFIGEPGIAYIGIEYSENSFFRRRRGLQRV